MVKVTVRIVLVVVAALLSITVLPDTAMTVVPEVMPVVADTVAPADIVDAMALEETVTAV